MKGSPSPNINTHINTASTRRSLPASAETHPPHKYDHPVQSCSECGEDVHLINDDKNECDQCGTVYDGHGWIIERPAPLRDEWTENELQ